MDDFKLTILGSGSAVPTSWHNPSSQVVLYRGTQYLVDCGEGTQMQMIRYKVKPKNLDHIFISHLHGDHYYGLIGLINSFHLMRREKPLHVYAPNDLKAILDIQLKVSNTTLYYPLVFHPLDDMDTELYSDDYFSVKAFPLKHSIPVWGFLFQEKERNRRIDKTFVKIHRPSIDEIKEIKGGSGFKTKNGKLLGNAEITLPPFPTRSYAYCSDTAYQASTAENVKGVDLLYHESTFDHSQKELAAKTLHSTAAQAAQVAKEAGARKLLLGHYSARFKELDSLLAEARKVFPESFLSKEGETWELKI